MKDTAVKPTLVRGGNANSLGSDRKERIGKKRPPAVGTAKQSDRRRTLASSKPKKNTRETHQGGGADPWKVLSGLGQRSGREASACKERQKGREDHL